MKRKLLYFGLLSVMSFSVLLTACKNLPVADEGKIGTLLAETVFAGITQTASMFTPTFTETVLPGVTPSAASIPTIAAIPTQAPTATNLPVYSYVAHTSTWTPTITITGGTITLTPAITLTPESMYWMCSDAERSLAQGDGCASFCGYYAASLESDGVACYSYGTRIYAPTVTFTAASTEVPTEIVATEVPTDMPSEMPTEVPSEVPTDSPAEEAATSD